MPDDVSQPTRGSTRDLISELAQSAVLRLEPERAELLPLVTVAYLDDPERILRADRKHDEQLGFGIGEAGVVLVAAAFYVAKVVVDHLIGRATDRAVDGPWARFTRRLPWRSKVRRAQAPAEVPAGTFPLSPSQADFLRGVAVEKAVQVGLPDAKARLLADAIIGGLIVRVE